MYALFSAASAFAWIVIFLPRTALSAKSMGSRQQLKGLAGEMIKMMVAHHLEYAYAI